MARTTWFRGPTGRPQRVVARPTPEKPKPLTFRELMAYSKAELVELATSRGVDPTGTRNDLLARLRGA